VSILLDVDSIPVSPRNHFEVASPPKNDEQNLYISLWYAQVFCIRPWKFTQYHYCLPSAPELRVTSSSLLPLYLHKCIRYPYSSLPSLILDEWMSSLLRHHRRLKLAYPTV